ncbi:FixH family protein [Candidatus Karelsulcia muelleri]|uniref:FixH family protein n=1 Tax=Candidatus Karelsulcia muelleri TaxID=336810 RepID=UPI0009BF0831|nr:FixH family protein [Candidatus Karelsulcia muelleri]MBU6942178.1 FixH family protein [Candidatus Karelsulcia muelleri]
MKINYKLLVFLFLFVFITFNIYISFIKKNINSELISNHYYEEEINYKKIIDSKKNASFIKIKIKTSNKGIHIFFPKNENYLNLDVNYFLIRYSNSCLDVRDLINTKNNYEIIIPYKKLKRGKYKMILKWILNRKEFLIEKNIIWYGKTKL